MRVKKFNRNQDYFTWFEKNKSKIEIIKIDKKYTPEYKLIVFYKDVNK